MSRPGVRVEVLVSQTCGRCRRASRMVAQLLAEAPFAGVTWREVDVVAELDYAVALGVLATPAIAVDGQLVLTSVSSERQLRRVLSEYLVGGENDET